MRTNVYYLAAPTPPDLERVPRLSRRLRLRLGLLVVWGRARVTATEIVDALRRFGRPDADVDPQMFEPCTDLVVVASRGGRRPGRLINLDAARSRLRS
jgi:hypothetical protein